MPVTSGSGSRGCDCHRGPPTPLKKWQTPLSDPLPNRQFPAKADVKAVWCFALGASRELAVSKVMPGGVLAGNFLASTRSIWTISCGEKLPANCPKNGVACKSESLPATRLHSRLAQLLDSIHRTSAGQRRTIFTSDGKRRSLRLTRVSIFSITSSCSGTVFHSSFPLVH